MSSVTAASPLHRAMLLRVAKSVVDRRDALNGALDSASLGEMDALAAADDIGLLALEARQDQLVSDALRAYHHAGGTVYNCLIGLPPQPADRPALPGSLEARLVFMGIPAEAAVIEGQSCKADSRHASAVIGILADYFREPPQTFLARPLPPDRWSTPDLPDDRAAERLVRSHVRTEEPSPFGDLLR